MLFFYLLFMAFGMTLLQESRISLTELSKEQGNNVSTVCRQLVGQRRRATLVGAEVNANGTRPLPTNGRIQGVVPKHA